MSTLSIMSCTDNSDTALPEEPALDVALAELEADYYLDSTHSLLGRGSEYAFEQRSSTIDALGWGQVRYRQLYRGVPVWEGDAIVQVKPDGAISMIDTFRKDIQLSVTPELLPDEARAIADTDLHPTGPYVKQPEVSLVVYPVTRDQLKAARSNLPADKQNADDFETVVERYVLAYHVQAMLENGADETKHMDYMIDANSGDVLKKWSTLMTAAAFGTGNSQYSGTKTLNVDSTTSGWQLKDVSRTMNITTYNLNHGTTGTGSVYTDTDNTWGDGSNYVAGGSTVNANGQTAAVDAHYGMATAYDLYKNVFGRTGFNGNGMASYNRVHYSSNYVNMFWSDTCYCMTYGDGNGSYKVLTSIDFIGHEVTHGVVSSTANLTYSGESGALNESLSDIMGTLSEFYQRGGSGSTIGSTGGNWTMGEQISTSPFRYLYKPSKDGMSPDAWSSSIGSLDIHYSSGPMNRAFYFLSQGSSNVSTSDYYSSYLPAGMTGVGNDVAGRIAFRALTVKMVSSTNYSSARTAFLNAATDLYGTTGPEYKAVQNAFAAINVGTPASSDSIPPSTSLTAPSSGATLTGTVTLSANASDNLGVTKVEFYAGTLLLGTDTTAPYSISWNSGSIANGAFTFTSKAYDAANNVTASAGVSATVSNSCSNFSNVLLNPGFESGATNWTQSGSIITNGATVAKAGSYYAWLGGYGFAHTDTLSQAVTIPSTACGPSLSFWLKVVSNETTTTAANDTLKVQLKNSAGTVLATLATYSNLNKSSLYAAINLDLSSYKGQTVTVVFTATENASSSTSFYIDDTALKSAQ